MNISIVGAGNMGGAIARGLAAHRFDGKIKVSSPNRRGELDALHGFDASIETTTDNRTCIQNADLIVIAVKPWLLKNVIDEISPVADFSRQTIVSIVAAVSCEDIAQMIPCDSPGVIRVIPNTAIAVGESMTFISALNVSDALLADVTAVFDLLGKTMVVEQRLMSAGTALASCGIAYAFRYVRAAAEGGVELGFYPSQAKEIVMQTLLGAVKLLEHTGNNPETEIDKVTTPGGITIRGLNAMEKMGFTTAVIEGLKSSNI